MKTKNSYFNQIMQNEYFAFSKICRTIILLEDKFSLRPNFILKDFLWQKIQKTIANLVIPVRNTQLWYRDQKISS